MFDPHNIILKSIKLDKSFKNLMALRKLKKYKKKLKIKKLYLKKIKKKARKFFYLKNYKKKLLISRKRFIKANSNLKKKWYENFWSKIRLSYFFKKKRKTCRKKKENWLRYKKRRAFLALKFRVRKKFLNKIELKRKPNITKGKNMHKINVRRRMAKFVWLRVKKSIKRQKTWWLLRIILRKTVIYYGLKNLKKLRFINKFNDSAMKLKFFNNNKLEFMLNIFLLRINMFDNIYVSNNFIKFSNIVQIDFKRVYDPFKCVKQKQIISFLNLKRMQSIFKNRILFSKYFFIKKYKFKKKSLFNRKLISVISNVPLHIHYDYQIMCFSIYRLPNKKELLNNKKGINDSWALDTKLQYN